MDVEKTGRGMSDAKRVGFDEERRFTPRLPLRQRLRTDSSTSREMRTWVIPKPFCHEYRRASGRSTKSRGSHAGV
ncbi:hypothetical protein BHM03_00009218, partial [Ensete ventricosum]